jgi:hypothetical protein
LRIDGEKDLVRKTAIGSLHPAIVQPASEFFSETTSCSRRIGRLHAGAAQQPGCLAKSLQQRLAACVEQIARAI